MLETARLILRPPIEADLPAWGKLLADAETMRFLGGPQIREAAWLRFVMIRSWQPPRNGMLSVVEKATNRWIGRIGTWRPEGWPGTEIGWTLTREARGRGLATEGATAAIDWAISDLGLASILHVIRPDNVAAASVARRLGSSKQRSAHLPTSGTLIDIWGQTTYEWAVNRLRAQRGRLAEPVGR